MHFFSVFIVNLLCFYIFMLYMLIHTVSAVEFVVGLWNRFFYSYAECGSVIEYNLTVPIVVHFKRGFGCSNALLFRVYNGSSLFYIFMLYMLILTV